MNKQTVNRLYDEVINGQTHINELYSSLAELRKKLTARLDKHTATEIFDDSLFKLIRKKLPNVDFYNLLSKTISDAKIDYFRKSKRRNDYEMITEDIDETAATVNDVEASVIKKETDHRQVIDSLLRLSPYDSATTAIVNGILQDTSGDVTPIGAGSKLGYHPETTKRKLRKLSRYYDEAVFGSIHELLSRVS